jgi:hypothetical protein
LIGLVSGLIENLYFTLNLIDTINRFSKPQYYTYKLIETLLPKAMVDLKKSSNLKMIEL